MKTETLPLAVQYVKRIAETNYRLGGKGLEHAVVIGERAGEVVVLTVAPTDSPLAVTLSVLMVRWGWGPDKVTVGLPVACRRVWARVGDDGELLDTQPCGGDERQESVLVARVDPAGDIEGHLLPWQGVAGALVWDPASLADADGFAAGKGASATIEMIVRAMTSNPFKPEVLAQYCPQGVDMVLEPGSPDLHRVASMFLLHMGHFLQEGDDIQPIEQFGGRSPGWRMGVVLPKAAEDN